jgi:phosphoribosyl-ATP pyrophosphohydrolase/phosphoribosyl-AMP cyclohydrolase
MHERGLGYISQKVVEEAGESIVAALEDKPDELIGEVADLFFHTAMLLREKGISMQDIADKLAERHQEQADADKDSVDKDGVDKDGAGTA